MPLLPVLLIILIALGVGALVGSATTYLVGALIGLAITVVALAITGAVVAAHSPSERTDGAPERQ